ncbi:MAG: TIGR00266 family protein [Coriobacteriia bacterium]|nr:TIGR00266 family protein [Coriobacteriia bacterium]
MQYRIIGEPMPVVECLLANGETMKTEAGSMVWMSPNMQMATTSDGGVGKALGRMVSGESLFLNTYTAQGGNGTIAFGSSFTGGIRAVQITPDRPLIAQKAAFLAAEMGVEISIHWQKKLGTALFGGEGFIMQQFSGFGMVFIEIDGSAVERDLAPGEQIVINTGNLVTMDASCTMDIVQVPGLKNKLLGGEGFFNTVVTGPGHVILQTINISSMASALSPYLMSGK